ncbi:MAG: tRNA (adenosine(37)-N6)-dimethylallyltransferase MiaA, partial [Eubacteriales bacterium]|nr:tRNA (adenosine(37)-N6)-dimethylallyltransferase MiaA [Eubacteriales bacterium]
ESCMEKLKQHTRNYAKRQLTWLARDQGIHWLRYEEDTQLALLLQDSTAFLRSCGV